MNNTTLHYIYDPLCGWCYGAAPLVKAAREVVTVRPHGGGMMTGARRQAVTPQLRAYVKPHDERIARLSGQRFGKAYVDGLLCDTGALFDSGPPTAAILAAEALGGRGLDMLAQIQVAHYVEGRRVAEHATLVDVAVALGFDPEVFAKALNSHLGDPVQTHFRETRAVMARVGANGFPSLVIEIDGGLQLVDFSRFFGQPQHFKDWLQGQFSASAAAPCERGPVCDDDGCATGAGKPA